MLANALGFVVPVVLVGAVIVAGLLYFRWLGSKQADLRQRRAAGEAPPETRTHRGARLTLGIGLLAVGLAAAIVELWH
jgi:UPF0716 family protein affecting phage T7 exclusion